MLYGMANNNGRLTFKVQGRTSSVVSRARLLVDQYLLPLKLLGYI